MSHRAIIAAVAAAAAFSAGSAALAGPAEDEIVAFENTWTQAWVKHDAAVLDRVLAPDWRGQSERGAVSKTQIIDIMKTEKDRTTSAVLHDVHPRIMGDIAVVQGMEDDKGIRDGKPYAETIGWTDVLQKRGGKWVAIASQNATLKPKR